MRLGVVTSQVNYVKDNYQHLLHCLLREHGPDIHTIIVIRTLSFKLIGKALGLYFMGCRGIAKNLLKNSARAIFSDPFKEFEKRGIAVHFTDNINSPETVAWVKSLQLDLLLNVRTRNIFKKEILSAPRWGCINIHHGILPDNRGTMSDLWALYEGRPVGYSIHWMNEKIDDGALIKVRSLTEISNKNYAELPYLSSLEEAKDLSYVLKELKVSNGKLEGQANRALHVRHTKNPTPRQLREMRESGIQL